MSSGTELQEMEVGTKQSKTAVNANAKPGDPMPDGPKLVAPLVILHRYLGRSWWTYTR